MVVERKKDCTEIKISEVKYGDTFCFARTNSQYGVCMKCVSDSTGYEYIVSIQTGKIVHNRSYNEESAVRLINGKFVEV